MKTNYLYHKIYNIKNLIFTWRKARKEKTKKDSVIEFEKLIESFQGWNAYAKWIDSYNLRKNIANKIKENLLFLRRLNYFHILLNSSFINLLKSI
jgi:hypothetical protein